MEETVNLDWMAQVCFAIFLGYFTALQTRSMGVPRGHENVDPPRSILLGDIEIHRYPYEKVFSLKIKLNWFKGYDYPAAASFRRGER